MRDQQPHPVFTVHLALGHAGLDAEDAVEALADILQCHPVALALAVAAWPLAALVVLVNLLPVLLAGSLAAAIPGAGHLFCGRPVAACVRLLAETAVFGLLAFGAGRLARAFDRLGAIERWARRITGVAFVGIGVWFVLAYSLRVV